jgi:hypothetical protein
MCADKLDKSGICIHDFVYTYRKWLNDVQYYSGRWLCCHDENEFLYVQ